MLFGIPERNNLEVILADIDGLRKQRIEIDTNLYGIRKGYENLIKRAILILKTVKEFNIKLTNNKYDIIFINTTLDKKALFRDLIFLKVIKKNHPKVFLKYHGSDLGVLNNFIFKYMFTLVFSRIKGLGVLSGEEKKTIVSMGYNEAKIHVTKCIVNPSYFFKDSNFRKKYEIAEDIPIFLFISRFIPSKGLLDVLNACIILNKTGQNFYLICVGDGPDKNKGIEITKQNNLQSKVKFVGFVPEKDTKEFYSNSDLLLFPTYHSEGFPMVVFQAAAAGLSIITTKIRASADYLVEPLNCIWVKEKNPEDLANKIQILLKDKDLMASMSVNNKILAEKFTQDIIVKEYIEIFDDMISNVS
jgi:glycosyltransferase involved in cell wall biosynthesis